MAAKIKSECPGVHWKHSYATTGGVDVVENVGPDDLKQVGKAATVIGAHGHSTRETLLATLWQEFISMLGKWHYAMAGD